MTIGVAERGLTERIAEQSWLAPLDQVLGDGFASVIKAGGPVGQQLQNFLHGTWLGHPLHPVLTDLPLGAWTTALLLDGLDRLNGDESYARGADAAITLGLAGAAGAALAGLADWQATDDPARKVGLLHGLLNLAGTATFATSLVLRRREQRQAAQVLSLLGYLVVGYSSWLGGNLVYHERIGVDHATITEDAGPTTYTAALPVDQLQSGKLAKGDANGVAVLLAQQGDDIYALADACSHLGCSLADGELQGESVRCPCHGSRFALADGRVLDGPATMPQPVYDVRKRSGQIEVRRRQ